MIPVPGRFRAVSTRNGVARSRDGQRFVTLRELGRDVLGERLFRIQFQDGLWMLAVESHLSAGG